MIPEPADAPTDQLQLLIQQGTVADAERLTAQGVDLAKLGYQPPERE